MDRVCLVGLVKIQLPSSTILICDGGFITYAGDTYQSKDPVFGTIGGISALTDGVGEEIPAIELTMLPAGSSAASDLSQPGFQKSTVQLWVAEKSEETGLLIGTPTLMFFGQIDQTVFKLGRATRDLAMTIVAKLERLFLRNEGNSLSPTFHKSVWPGETGHDNATGLVIPIAWGTESTPGASTAGSASTGAIGGTFNLGFSGRVNSV